MTTKLITSTHNPSIRQIDLLQQKSSERKRQGLFVVEGIREIRHCIDGGYEVESIYCREGHSTEVDAILDMLPNAEIIDVSDTVYSHIAYRESTEGAIALVKSRYLPLQEIRLQENPLIVVLEGVEKPGNLGAVLRSADAAGADAVIICDPLTDLYNPNLIRSSLGARFTMQCTSCTSEECIAFLRSRNVKILTAQLQDSHAYYSSDMKSGVALVMGTESTGLTDLWRWSADAHILIPMLGKVDSLNVSVSTAILLYEAVRQRMSEDESSPSESASEN